jgi:hypothetical protein
MAPRIESAEVVSFRLKVPRLELERLQKSEVGQDLALTLTQEGVDLLLAPSEGESHLRFRPIGAEAILTDVFLLHDAQGGFLLRVLGPLMVRFAGDLELQVVWSVPERNSEGAFALVTITRGITDYPGLGSPPSTGASPTADAQAATALRNTLRAGGEELAEHGPTAEEREVLELLQRAREQYQEYLRLKNRR